MCFRATFPAAPRQIAAIRAELTGLARQWGFEQRQVEAVALAVSEAVTNAIVHGYDGREGTIRVQAGLADEEMTVVVADQGGGLAPRTDSGGLGLGLPLIASVTERTEITTDPGGGTEVRMVFRRAVQTA